MKKAIALYGKGDSGKTSTLNLLIDLIVSENKGIPMTIHTEEELRKNCRAVLSYKGKIIGVGTWGDSKDQVEKNCNFFKEKNCDLIYTATRTRGETCKAIKDFVSINRFSLEWVKKKYRDTNRYSENLKQAQELFNLIK